MTSKIVFTTDDLPPELDERARRSQWQELYMRTICPLDVSYLPERPLSLRFAFARAGAIGFGQYRGTMRSIVRTPRAAAADGAPAFHLSFNTGPALFQYDTGADQTDFRPGDLMLSAMARSAKIQSNDVNGFQGIVIPQQLLLERVPGAEALAFTVIPDSAATRLLRGYLNVLSEMNDFSDDAALSDHVETTLLDLAVLAIGASRERAEVAQMRGLRAARTRTIIAEIKKSFADPAISSEYIAQTLGVSRRHVNDLLYESGQSLADRVLELRLQKARAILANHRHDRMKVSDIALACGFNEVSYFNRCFRRRFGTTPTAYRGNGSGNGNGAD